MSHPSFVEEERRQAETSSSSTPPSSTPPSTTPSSVVVITIKTDSSTTATSIPMESLALPRQAAEFLHAHPKPTLYVRPSSFTGFNSNPSLPSFRLHLEKLSLSLHKDYLCAWYHNVIILTLRNIHSCLYPWEKPFTLVLRCPPNLPYIFQSNI